MKRSKPIRRKAIPKRPRRGERGSARMAILHRAHGACEWCGKPILSNSWEDHHIFFKSFLRTGVAKAIRDQLWNRCALHDACHALAHREDPVRRKLEELALHRLEDRVGPFVWAKLMRDRQGTVGTATVIAYVRHCARTLADVVAEEIPPENAIGFAV